MSANAGYDQAQLLYLKQLGIDVWVPRDALVDSNTADDVEQSQASVEYNQAVHAQAETRPSQETPSAQTNPVVQANSSSLSNQPETSQHALAKPVVDTQSSAPQINVTSAPAFPLANPIAESSSTNIPPASQESVPEFTLNYWCYRSGLWVVTAEANLTPQHHAFVHNVAQALQGMKSKPKHVGMFVWPMLDAPNVDQGESVAKRYLAEHFEQLKAFVEPKHLLCFAGSDQWLTELPSTGIDGTLAETMSSIDSKRALWQTIQPLSSFF
ncbi:hypothetical protein HF888_02850 [Bermanella marisrubri]|uniref:Uncharacterized protein n=1 Tax=Bermanella marisrubri TaxID=207949 RepID=Q1N0C7_9GAMM|nr:hypothetical protein [Bermanella marisrubri]EAT11737.1 hypothetical protein RED65_06302 [Oceanobacter sp. RED65] [Bermanella marisrubri]QIZ83231.1 hypothetical protein HF888_02850 [Bermanella marisrubri]